MTVLPAGTVQAAEVVHASGLVQAADLGSAFAQTVLNGPLLLAMAVAAIAGLVSFLSPCVLPLVPSYLGVIGGARAPLWRALGFILGFGLVFIALGATASSLGALLAVEVVFVVRHSDAGQPVLHLGSELRQHRHCGEGPDEARRAFGDRRDGRRERRLRVELTKFL